jgi:hypothetical protein
MPRPDKEINPGRLDGPVSPSRSHSWSKYGVNGGSHRGAPSALEDTDDEIALTVDDITVVVHSDDAPSKYSQRGAAAYGAGLPDNDVAPSPVVLVTEWVTNRQVTDRTYRRSDELITVEVRG